MKDALEWKTQPLDGKPMGEAWTGGLVDPKWIVRPRRAEQEDSEPSSRSTGQETDLAFGNSLLDACLGDVGMSGRNELSSLDGF